MSKSSKAVEEIEELRDAQTEAMQTLLFTMQELGQPSALLQLEMDGVLHCLAARQITQAEFDEIVRQAICKP